MDWTRVDWWTVAGSGTLGLTIGWLVRSFFVRVTTLSIQAISTLASIAAGGSLIALWRVAKVGTLSGEANSYFIGVFASVLVLGLLDYKPPNSN
jgi:hypothetical protein